MEDKEVPESIYESKIEENEIKEVKGAKEDEQIAKVKEDKVKD